MQPVAAQVREFVIANFLFGQDNGQLQNGQSFLESGVVDSTGVLELVTFIEERFGISVEDRELLPQNLDSIDNVARFVEQKLAAAGNPVSQ
ncbi:MAG: acyl carrier protein [Vicinamibacterales bacterium]